MASAEITATSPATKARSTQAEVPMPRQATLATAARMATNSTQPPIATCSVTVSNSTRTR